MVIKKNHILKKDTPDFTGAHDPERVFIIKSEPKQQRCTTAATTDGRQVNLINETNLMESSVSLVGTACVSLSLRWLIVADANSVANDTIIQEAQIELLHPLDVLYIFPLESLATSVISLTYLRVPFVMLVSVSSSNWKHSSRCLFFS